MRKINNIFYRELFSRLPNAKTLILSYKALSFIRPEFVNHVYYLLTEDFELLSIFAVLVKITTKHVQITSIHATNNNNTCYISPIKNMLFATSFGATCNRKTCYM